MRYNILKATAPAMPNLGKGTECIKLLLSQASKDMHEGGNKGQLSHLVEAICRDFRLHDDAELKKLVEWQQLVKTKSANKDKPARPDVAFWFPPSDVTNPAFIQNAMALEKLDGRTQYINMPEVEMADRMCGGHKQVSQMIRNIYDRQRAGALRATADGVTGNPLLRCNLSISSTPIATRLFYKNDLFNGTFGRMVVSYKPRTSRDGRIPRQGKYTDEFYEKLDEYITRLGACKGRFVIRPLNKLTDRLAQDMASLADLADDDVLFEISHRSLVSAWKAGCILWILNNQMWTKAMGELVEWLVYHDIWSKMQVFGDLLSKDSSQENEACWKVCPTVLQNSSCKPCAPNWERALRVLVRNCVSGCTASSSSILRRRDSIRRRRNTWALR